MTLPNTLGIDTWPTLPWIEETASVYRSKISDYSQALSTPSSPERREEIACTQALFKSAHLAASFHINLIPASTYISSRDAAFQNPDLHLATSPTSLLANAQTLLDLQSQLSEHESPPDDFYAQKRWAILTSSIASLTAASKIPGLDHETLAKTHSLRGEASFLQWMLALPPITFKTAAENQGVLLRNAEVFYRNAGKFLTGQREEGMVMEVRSGVAVWLQEQLKTGGAGVKEELWAFLGRALEGRPLKGEMGIVEWVREEIGEMVEDGLLPESLGES